MSLFDQLLQLRDCIALSLPRFISQAIGLEDKVAYLRAGRFIGQGYGHGCKHFSVDLKND